MKQTFVNFFFLGTLFFGIVSSGCKTKATQITPTDSEIAQYSEILLENQKIQDFLFQEEEKLPNLDPILAAIKKLSEISQEGLISRCEKLIKTLADLDSNDLSDQNREKFFLALSSFSEDIADLNQFFPNSSGFYKFYCPMVEKTWVSKGLSVRNPYAPEMRDCGERIP